MGVAIAGACLTAGRANAQTSTPDLWKNVSISKFGQLANLNTSQRPAPADGVLLSHHLEKSMFQAEEMAINTAGDQLVYTDTDQNLLAIVDLTDPSNPRPDGVFKFEGRAEPTSVALHGNFALVTVDLTGYRYSNPSGYLAIIDLDTRTEVRRLDLGGQPGKIAVSSDGAFAAISISNERDPDLEVNGLEGAFPQAPAGELKILSLQGDSPQNWTPRTVSLLGLAQIGTQDPEPRRVKINEDGKILISLYANNHLVIVDTKNADAISHFSAGTVSVSGVDTQDDNMISPTDTITDRMRQPNGIAWIDGEHFVTANYGASIGQAGYERGTRGFTIFNLAGEVVFDSGNQLERLMISAGLFDDNGSDARGIQVRSVDVADFGDDRLLFVGIRASDAVAVYRLNADLTNPEFVQIIPSGGSGLHSLLSIPQRKLFLTANAWDQGITSLRSTIGVFQQNGRPEAKAQFPELASKTVDGVPLGWVSLSGLNLERDDYTGRDKIWAVASRTLQPSSIFRINPRRKPARIVERIDVTENGAPAELDLQGIARRQEGGFWLASTGYASANQHSVLVRVDDAGQVQQRVELPQALNDQEELGAFSGVAVSHDDQGRELVTAVLRFRADQPNDLLATKTIIGRYLPEAGTWTFYSYPLDQISENGLSEARERQSGVDEIIHIQDNRFALLETDRMQGNKAQIRRVYEIELPEEGTPHPETPAAITEKNLVLDLLPTIENRKGWTPEGLSGMCLNPAGRFTFVSDNLRFSKRTPLNTLFFSVQSDIELDDQSDLDSLFDWGWLFDLGSIFGGWW